MIEKHYVGESGTEIRINCNRDISEASSHKAFLKRPDGTIIEFVTEIYPTNYLRFFTLPETFNTSGLYEVQPYVEIGGWAGRGKTVSFVVYEKYT